MQIRTTDTDEEQDDLDDHSGAEYRKRAVQHRRVCVGMPSALHASVASSRQVAFMPRAASGTNGSPEVVAGSQL